MHIRSCDLHTHVYQVRVRAGSEVKLPLSQEAKSRLDFFLSYIFLSIKGPMRNGND